MTAELDSSVQHPDHAPDFPWTEADAMYLLLVRRAAELRDRRLDAGQEEELDCLWNAIDSYEAKRWT